MQEVNENEDIQCDVTKAQHRIDQLQRLSSERMLQAQVLGSSIISVRISEQESSKTYFGSRRKPSGCSTDSKTWQPHDHAVMDMYTLDMMEVITI